jgi:hypothetical protein
MRRNYLQTALPFTLLLAGCATHGVDRHYGEAWSQMEGAETYNVRAGDDSPVLGMDPVQEMRGLAAMRNDVADRSAIKSQPFINISQNTSGGGGGGGQ